MAPDQGSGATPTSTPKAAAALKTDMLCTCGREEPHAPARQQHERKLSSSAGPKIFFT